MARIINQKSNYPTFADNVGSTSPTGDDVIIETEHETVTIDGITFRREVNFNAVGEEVSRSIWSVINYPTIISFSPTPEFKVGTEYNITIAGQNINTGQDVSAFLWHNVDSPKSNAHMLWGYSPEDRNYPANQKHIDITSISSAGGIDTIIGTLTLVDDFDLGPIVPDKDYFYNFYVWVGNMESSPYDVAIDS